MTERPGTFWYEVKAGLRRLLALPIGWKLAIGVVIALVVVVIIVDPFGGDDDKGDAVSDYTPFVPTLDPTRFPPPEETTAPGNGCESLEDCYSYDEMEPLLNDAIDFVGTFVDAQYADRLWPDNFYYVGSRDAGPTGCFGGYDGESFMYCPADNSIYIGQDFLWEVYDGIGDAAAVTGLAHEWGHHLQDRAEIPAADTASEQIPRENQADCVAGAFIQYADQQGWMEYPDDIDDLEGMILFIAEAESADRTHGTLEERAQSFGYGLENGLFGCNDWFPTTPLITS